MVSEAQESLIIEKSNSLTSTQLFSFEPETSTIEGKLMQKTYFGRPNFGQTPEIDEQILVLILQPNSPITVIAPIFQDVKETAYSTVRNISEIQLFSFEPSLNLKENLNKKIKITGRFIKAETSGHYTPILFQIDKLE